MPDAYCNVPRYIRNCRLTNAFTTCSVGYNRRLQFNDCNIPCASHTSWSDNDAKDLEIILLVINIKGENPRIAATVHIRHDSLNLGVTSLPYSICFYITEYVPPCPTVPDGNIESCTGGGS